jgi:opacity protein-like surface antigen
MKKKVIAATLAALYSTSALAEKDAFSIGISTEYLLPLIGEEKKLFGTPLGDFGENINKGSMLFISPYIGYNIMDNVRIGITGIMGFSDYKYISDEQKPEVIKKTRVADLGVHSDTRLYSKIHPRRLQEVNHLRVKLDGLLQEHRNYREADMDSEKLKKLKDKGASVLLGTDKPALMELVRLKERIGNYDSYSSMKLTSIEEAESIADLNRCTLTAERIRDHLSLMSKEGKNQDIEGQLNAMQDIVDVLREIDGCMKRISKDSASSTNSLDFKKATVSLTPNTALLTADVKLYTNDTLSLSVGGGIGMTHWSYNMERDESNKGDNFDNATWTIAGKAHGSVSFNLSDVADLNLSLGYMHLGSPKFNSKSGKSSLDLSEKIRSHGVTGSISLSKDF